jgi:hypothetical protein
MVLCDERNNTNVGLAQRRLHWRAIFTPSKHFFGAAFSKEHRPHAASQSGVTASATQAPYWLLHFAAAAKMSVQCIDDASCTK